MSEFLERLWAILGRRCPRCREGAVFCGIFRYQPICAVCGLTFEREPGYYLGALYFGYGLGLALSAPGSLVAWSRGLNGGALALVIFVQVVLVLPLVVPYARVCWLHLDHIWDPRECRSGETRFSERECGKMPVQDDST